MCRGHPAPNACREVQVAKRAQPAVLLRMMHSVLGHDPLPDLSTGSCVGSKNAENWHADLHRAAALREAARRVCLTCPVLDECRAYALRNPLITGTWGGLTERERERMREEQWRLSQRRHVAIS